MIRVLICDDQDIVLEGLQAILRAAPEIEVAGVADADEWVFDAIRSGASGYLLKDTPTGELIEAIIGTAAGKTHVDPNVAGKLFAQITQSPPRGPKSSIGESLSEREREVLRFMTRGFTNADIAQKLYLSEGTVKNYVSAIFTKLGVSDRTQAAVIALRHGLVDMSEI